MFTFWQLSRNRARTIVLLLASVTKIEVDVTYGNGAQAAGLNISPQSKEKYMSSPYLENFLYGAKAVGAYSQEARRKEPEGTEFGDVDFGCISALEAIYTEREG